MTISTSSAIPLFAEVTILKANHNAYNRTMPYAARRTSRDGELHRQPWRAGRSLCPGRVGRAVFRTC